MIAVRVIALDLPSRAQGTHNQVDRALIRSSYGYVPETPYMELSKCCQGKVPLLVSSFLRQIRPPQSENSLRIFFRLRSPREMDFLTLPSLMPST